MITSIGWIQDLRIESIPTMQDVQQKFQDILSFVEDAGLPEGEYLKVCNSLRDIFKQLPEPKECKYRNRIIFVVPLPPTTPILTVYPTHKVGFTGARITFEKIEKVSYETKNYEEKWYSCSSYRYHLKIQTWGSYHKEVGQDTTMMMFTPGVEKTSQYLRIFDPLDPKDISLTVNGITIRYTINDLIVSLWNQQKEQWKLQNQLEDEEERTFEEWCSEFEYDDMPKDKWDICGKILTDAIDMIHYGENLKDSEKFNFLMGQ